MATARRSRWRTSGRCTPGPRSCGARTPTCPPFFFAAQAEALGAEPLVVPGGHFFLQQSTDLAEDLVRTHLPA